MEVVDFNREHLSEAAVLGMACYEEERRASPALPLVERMPGLEDYAGSGMGAAALENGRLVGYLCGFGPFDHPFGSTDVRGVFSPMGANAARREQCGKIYAALYRHAARAWVRAGAVSHGICLYAHNEEAQKQFFQYGFGMRCVDSVRLLNPVPCASSGEWEFVELSPEECIRIYPLERRLNEHYRTSPFFMNRALEPLEKFRDRCETGEDRCFAARLRGSDCAYLKLSKTGETFITENAPFYRHITGAFCLPEHRGKDVMQNLLNFVQDILQKEGCTHLGVDFESINPAAYGFWEKYFTAYTCGVVRRIDERILRTGTGDTENCLE